MGRTKDEVRERSVLEHRLRVQMQENADLRRERDEARAEAVELRAEVNRLRSGIAAERAVFNATSAVHAHRP